MNLIFSEETMPADPLREKFREAAEWCARQMGFSPGRMEVSVTFADEDEIRELNRQYRNVDKVTDVLSFPQYEGLSAIPREGTVCLGDVVICTGQALIQADEFGHSPERELVYLFVHSLFHLFGFDHLDPEEKQEMRRLEELVMEKVNLKK